MFGIEALTAAVREQSRVQHHDAVLLIAATNRQAAATEKLVELLRRAARPGRPNLTINPKGEKQMALKDFIVCGVKADPSASGDVVKRVLSVSIGGTEPTVSEHPAGTLEFPDVEVPQDATCKLTLVDVDDAGNQSVPAEVEFVAVDSFAPQAATGLGVSFKEEVSREVPDEPAPE